MHRPPQAWPMAGSGAEGAAIGQNEQEEPRQDHGQAQDLAQGDPVESQVAEVAVALNAQLGARFHLITLDDAVRALGQDLAQSRLPA